MLRSNCNVTEVADPCDPDPCVHGNCEADGESFTCNCDDGYEGELCDSGATIIAILL